MEDVDNYPKVPCDYAVGQAQRLMFDVCKWWLASGLRIQHSIAKRPASTQIIEFIGI